MSGITLRDYMSTAKLDQSGTIRTTRDDASQLVNKGTLGNRIASWFQKTFTGLAPDRETRQRAALDGFRNALAGTFGTEVAKLALAGIEEYGRTENPRLTGRMITVAINNAKAISTGNQLANAGSVNNLLPPPQGGTATPEFLALVKTLGDDMTPDQLSPKELAEFEARFRSRTGSLDLTSDRLHARIQDVARQTIAEVHGLAGAGKLDAAIKARQEVAGALKEIIRQLAAGKSPEMLMPLLAHAARWLERHARIEDLGDGAQDQQGDIRQQGRTRTMDATRMILGQVIRELNQEEPGLVGGAQENALSHGSPLRAVLAQMGAQPGDQLSPRQQSMLDRIADMSAAIVQGIATLGGPETVSPEDDVKRLQATTDLSGTAQQRALRPVNRLLNWVNDHPTAPGQFVNHIKSDYAITNPETGEVTWKKTGGFPQWNSVELLESLEQHVRHHAVEDRLPIDLAVANMRAVISEDATMPPELKSKLLAGLDAILEEFRLRAKATTCGFHNLKQEDFWRLFVPQRLVGEDISKWDIEHREQGSLAGMQRGFRQMLETTMTDPREPLDGKGLDRFHMYATTNCFRGNLLAITYRDDTFEDQKLEYLKEAPLRPGFRDGPTGLILRKGTETTPEGLRELGEFAQDPQAPWFQVLDDNLPNEFRLAMPLKTPDECEAFANQVLGDFYQQLPNQQTDNDKRLLVAATVQTLYRAHLFEDGNSRAVVFTATNRLLLDAGLSPAILPEPKGAAGFSRQQFADEIRKGQMAFELLTKPHDVSVTDLLTRQLERIEDEEVPRATGIADLRGLIDGNEGLPDDLRTEALRCLDAEALRLEDTFYSHLQEVPGFSGIRRDEVWRLFGGEHVRHPDVAHQLPQLEHAFDQMLGGLRLNLPLNAEHLELINTDGPSPGYRADLLDPDQCRQRINDILADYRNGIENADTDQAKLQVIADAVKRLYAGKFFADGDVQSTVLMVMNRMLVDAGLSPSILGDPTSLGRDSSNKVVDAIAQGQLAFRWHARSADTNTAGFLHSEAERHAREFNVPLQQAFEALLASIVDNPAIPQPVRDEMTNRLTTMIDAAPHKDSVVDQLDEQRRDIKALEHVKKDDLWRLIATGREQSDRTPNHLTSRDDLLQRHGVDVVVGMERACGVMLEGYRNNTRLDADHILAINEANPQAGLRHDSTELVSAMGGLVKGAGGMVTDTGLVVTAKGNWFDEAGVKQMLLDDPWYQGGELRDIDPDNGRRRYQLTLPGGKSPEQCRDKLQSILDQYETDIQKAGDDVRAKRAAIGKAVQEMYQAQMFGDGERQSTVFMVMNRMLLDAGLSPAIYLDPTQAFGLRPSSHGTAILQGQNGFRQFIPKPIEVVVPPPDDNLLLFDAINDESSEDANPVAPENLQFHDADGRRTANARDLMSPMEWTMAHSGYSRDLITDSAEQNRDIRNVQRQQKLDSRDMTFSRDGAVIGLKNADEVHNVIRNNVDLQDVVIRDKPITVDHAADGLARYMDSGLFDRIYDTVVSKYAPDLRTERPPIDFSIQTRQDGNNQPVYEITMRGRMPERMVGDGLYDLVVTLEVDATASILYDTGSARCRLESR